MERKETAVNRIVGIKDGELWICEGFFKHSDDFAGATGFVMRPLTDAEIDANNLPDNYIEYYRELWKEAVRTDHTEYGLEEFAEDCLNNEDGVFPGDDPSFREETENLVAGLSPKHQAVIFLLIGDYKTWTCTRCGRIFTENEEFDYIFDKKLLKKIKQIEKTA